MIPCSVDPILLCVYPSKILQSLQKKQKKINQLMLKYVLLKTIENNKWQTGKYVYPASRKLTSN